MPKSKAAAQHDQRIIEKERDGNAARQRTESVAEIGREEKEQTATGQKAALDGTLRTGSLPVRAKARDQFSAKHRAASSSGVTGCLAWDRGFADSPLEEGGFELMVSL
jgi:hypothetical protein